MENNEITLHSIPPSVTAWDAMKQASASAESFAKQSKAPNTVKGYGSDWKDFQAWCVARQVAFLPASAHTVSSYLGESAARLKASSLQRRLSSISQAHQLAGFESPTGHAAVRAVMAGIRRTKGTAPAQKSPTLKEDLLAMLAGIPADTLIGARDAALLLVGFGAALRRSELVAVDVEDLELSERGLVLLLRRSKTDQTGEGRKIAIASTRNPATCAAAAVRCWLDLAGITSGPLFRAVNRHGHLSDDRLTDKTVARVVKARAEAAGLNPDLYSGHSLRAGLATAAALAGASEADIARQTGHKSVAMVRRYVRIADVWRSNVTHLIGL